jgi:hypothetical protein
MTDELPQLFIQEMAHFLSGYPQHIQQAFVYSGLSPQVPEKVYFMGFTCPGGQLDADWAELTFIPYLEGLIETHASQCEVELNLIFLDEEPVLRQQVLAAVLPFYGI